MEKKLLGGIPGGVPREIKNFISGANIYDSSCSPEAKVYYIEKGRGYYLKTSRKESLKREMEMTEYFHSKGLGAEVLAYVSDGGDWLLTASVAGEDCTHEKYMENPERLCDTLAHQLRKLHETDYSDCPVADRTAEYLAAAEKNYRTGNYDKSQFPDSFGYRSAGEAHNILYGAERVLKSKVLLHGDYCLPNIILDDWAFSGFVDVGSGGVGDRHIDLFWGTWTLWFNLKTNKYRARFLDAYGRDKADESLLKIIAAAEVFG